MEHDVTSTNEVYNSQGSRVHGHLSRPEGPGPWPGVILGHDFMGTGPHYDDICRRLAAEGFVVLAPDLYHGETADDLEHAAELKAALDVGTALDELLDGVAFLRAQPAVADHEGIVGFCMSGGLALTLAGRSDVLDGAVAYYPSMSIDNADIERISCPVLVHYGTADEISPPSEMSKLQQAMDDSTVDYQFHEYEGADHAFIMEPYEDRYHPEAAARSWDRTIGFLRRHLGG